MKIRSHQAHTICLKKLLTIYLHPLAIQDIFLLPTQHLYFLAVHFHQPFVDNWRWQIVKCKNSNHVGKFIFIDRFLHLRSFSFRLCHDDESRKKLLLWHFLDLFCLVFILNFSPMRSWKKLNDKIWCQIIIIMRHFTAKVPGVKAKRAENKVFNITISTVKFLSLSSRSIVNIYFSCVLLPRVRFNILTSPVMGNHFSCVVSMESLGLSLSLLICYRT